MHRAAPFLGTAAIASRVAAPCPLPPDPTCRPLPTRPLSELHAADKARKPAVTQRQRSLPDARCDLVAGLSLERMAAAPPPPLHD